jgi:hypothetical protein
VIEREDRIITARNELEVRAAAVNVNPATYPNDSVLEQKVLYEEQVMTAKAGTATTTQPSAKAVQEVSGWGKNV